MEMNIKELIENLSNLMLIYLICLNKSESTILAKFGPVY